MPQATQELRDLMGKWFGDRVSEAGPMAFLESRGWTEEGGLYKPPVPAHTPTHEEAACLLFMLQEWDFEFDYMEFPYA